MKARSIADGRTMLALLAILAFAATRSSADVLYTVTDLGTTASSPSIPDSLKNPQLSNTFGESARNLAGPLGGPGPSYSRVEFLDRDGQLTQIGQIGNLSGSSFAYALNDTGQVVGQSFSSGGIGMAFLYTSGKTFDLNTLILPGLPIADLILTAGDSIDNQGRILATGVSSGVQHLVLLTPSVPEPTTLALIGCVSIGLGARAGLRRLPKRAKVGARWINGC
jgi:probable HAF family extracellular repeat protein